MFYSNFISLVIATEHIRYCMMYKGMILWMNDWLYKRVIAIVTSVCTVIWVVNCMYNWACGVC